MKPQAPRLVTELIQLANRLDIYNFGRVELDELRAAHEGWMPSFMAGPS